MIQYNSERLDRAYSAVKEYAPVIGVSLLLLISMVAGGAIYTQPVGENQSGSVEAIHTFNHDVIGFESGSLSPNWEILDDSRKVEVNSDSASEGNYSAILGLTANVDEEAKIQSNFSNPVYADSINGDFQFSYDLYRSDTDYSDKAVSKFVITTDTGDDLIIRVQSGNTNPDRQIAIEGDSVDNTIKTGVVFDINQWLTVNVSGDDTHITATLLNETGSELGTVTAQRTSQIDTDNQLRLEAFIPSSDVTYPYIRYDNIETLGPPDVTDPALEIDTRNYIKHGNSTPYTVYYTNPETGEVLDVSDSPDLTVNSSNTSVFTLDRTNNLVVATSDTSINQRETFSANYANLTQTENVTVANATVENLRILPGITRVQATYTDSNIVLILVGTMLGVVATRAASAFAGLGALQLTLVAGFFVDLISLGVVLTSLFAALFIGLNMAANIDYTVRRG